MQGSHDPHRHRIDYDERLRANRVLILRANADAARQLLSQCHAYLAGQTNGATFALAAANLIHNHPAIRGIVMDAFIDLEVYNAEYSQAHGRQYAGEDPILKSIAMSLKDELSG